MAEFKRLALYNNTPAWEDKEKKVVCDMFDAGYSDEDIAKRLQRTPKAVEAQRYKLKLYRSTRPLHRREFRIHDAMADYYPKWYKKLLKQRWQEQQTSTK